MVDVHEQDVRLGRHRPGHGVLLNQPRTVEALTFLRAQVDDDVLPAEVVGYEWNRPVRMLARGQGLAERRW